MEIVGTWFSEDHKMLQQAVHDFANDKVAPLADKLDHSEEFPVSTFKEMAQLGFFGVNIPPEYGGSGGDTVSYTIISEELARVCASTSNIFGVQTTVIRTVYCNGSEEQRRRLLPPLINGQVIAAIAVTEAEAGSDVGNIKTTAVKQGNDYFLNGTKVFISHAPVCDVAVVLAKDPTLGPRRMDILFVPADTPGFTRGKKYSKLGYRATATGELNFENCCVPSINLLGNEGDGLRQILTNFEFVRIGVAAEALGITRSILDKASEYAKQRVAFGHPISDYQAISCKLADIATELQAARLLTYGCAQIADRGIPYSYQAAMAKLFASELCMKAAEVGIQIFGGYGYMMDSPMQRHFRDAKLTTIFEGTSEIQRLIIYRGILKSYNEITSS